MAQRFIGPFAGMLASVVLSAQTGAPAQTDAPPSADDKIEEMCAALVNGQADKMQSCRDQESEAYGFVMTWMNDNGFLLPDGTVDQLQILESAADPLTGVDSPSSVFSFCFEQTSDWVDLGECISSLDQGAQYGAAGFSGQDFDPSLLGPDIGP